jgi:glycine/serine hydroxymethyltransferase
MAQIGGWIGEILSHIGSAETEQRVRKEVADLAALFPIYEARVSGTSRIEHARA